MDFLAGLAAPSLWQLTIALIFLPISSLLLYHLVLSPISRMLYYRRYGLSGTTFKPLVGDLLAVAKARKTSTEYFYAFWNEILGAKGDLAYFFLGPEFRLRTVDVELLKVMLTTQASSFIKPGLMKRVMGMILGNGLLLSEGKEWRRHREMISPAFNHLRMKDSVPLMAKAAQAVVTKWKAAHAKHAVDGAVEVDMHHEMSGTTLEIITRAAFGDIASNTEDSDKIYVAVNELLALSSTAVLSLRAFLPFFQYLPIPSNYTLWSKISSIKQYLTGIIDRRRTARAAGRVVGDEVLLDYLLDARDGIDGKGNGFTSTELFDEAITFALAGHETTSQALSWSLMLLSQHPEWKQKLRQQVLDVLGSKPADGSAQTNNKGRAPTYDDLARMPLLKAVLWESMRLFPPIPLIVREAAQDFEYNGIKFLAGTTFNIPIASIHRDARHWPNPHVFDPNRWSAGIQGACTHPFAYLPFSHGPRNCIGSQFAMQEAQIILAVILQNVDCTLAPTYIHAPTMSLTLRPGKGMPMRVQML
jgi:cytochrome P450